MHALLLIVISALQLMVVYCHILNGKQMIQLRDLPNAKPSWKNKHASRPAQVEANER
jgi:hypothetical protein